MTLDKNNAGGVLTILQNHIHSQISHYTSTDLLYNILKFDEQDINHRITHTVKPLCISTCACLCMYVYLCIHACIDSMLVCVHKHI